MTDRQTVMLSSEGAVATILLNRPDSLKQFAMRSSESSKKNTFAFIAIQNPVHSSKTSANCCGNNWTMH